jgi:glycosyltransferase involved in cell wall biosynthesis
VGGVLESILDGITGWAVSEATAEALAERLLFCLTNREWVTDARAEGPAFVRRQFSIEAAARRTLDVYGLT